MPPGTVEKAWTSQGSLERAGTWRRRSPREERLVQEGSWGFGTERFSGRDLVGMEIYA